MTSSRATGVTLWLSFPDKPPHILAVWWTDEWTPSTMNSSVVKSDKFVAITTNPDGKISLWLGERNLTHGISFHQTVPHALTFPTSSPKSNTAFVTPSNMVKSCPQMIPPGAMNSLAMAMSRRTDS